MLLARRCLSTTATTTLYSYHGSKRWSGLQYGVGGVGLYLAAKSGLQWYTGITTIATQFGMEFLPLSPFEIAAFGFVWTRQAMYLSKLVGEMTLSADGKQVGFQTYNFVGLPKRQVQTFSVQDLELTTLEDRLYLKPRFGKRRNEYFILLQRDAKIEQLFSPYETF
ncbi:hypothetical protein BASA81_012137 [Batrachochytrium salamandrivorans]|nr:hypothetical protein BASA81_012137 [Batrachochytrium salamandrivorans]